MSHVIHYRMLKFYYREEFIFQFSSLYKEQKNALKLLHGFTDRVIKERRRKNLTEAKGNSNKDNFDESFGQKRKMNLLDILLQSTINGEQLTDLDIREEVDTFMFEVRHFYILAYHYPTMKLTFDRVTTPRHLQYYFVCITLPNIPTYSENVSKKSEKF